MSTVSKVVLGVSVGLTLSTVAAVHLNQTWDRERLHEGVVRDLERQDRRKDNLRLLEEQRSLTAQLQEEQRRSRGETDCTAAGGAEEEQRSLTAQLQEEQRSLTVQLQEEQRSLTAQLQEEQRRSTETGVMDSSSEPLGGGEDEGLEEGEVEGETLLIVESEDQGSVDLSHDQSGDSLTSELEEGGGCEETSFHCDRCHKWIPAAQLRGEQPSYLKGDNFFKFVCSDCSEDGKESFERMRLTWQQVVMLAMYNLSLEGTGRQGYFRWKEDICAFIGRHWNFLLGTRKKTSTWWSTVAGCLSVGSPTFFRSGAQEFGEPGWWKLVQNRPPTLRPDTEKSTTKAKASKPVMEPIITVEGLRKRGARNPVENAIQLKEKRCRTQEAKDIRRAQKEASGGGGGYTDRSASSTPVKLGGGRGGNAGRRPDLVLEKGEVIDFSSLSSSDRTPLTSPSPSPSPDFSAPGTPASHSATPSLLSEADLIPDAMPPQALFHDDEEMETEGMIDPGMEYLPPPRASLVARKKLRPAAPHIKREAESEDDEGHDEEFEGPVGRREGPSLSAGGCVGAGGPERRRINHPEKADEEPQTPCFSPLSLYEERMLLRRLASCPLALAVTPQAKRLHRKLLVRQAKRQRGLPLLDVDRAVSATLSLVGGIYGATGTLMRGGLLGKYCTNSQESRILDRFQTNLSSRRGLQQTPVSFCHRLTGAEGSSDLSIKSPYTARILKPYIRRDYESRPVKLRLLEEIRAYPHRKNPNWVPEPNAPIDYCYVRPNHIPSVNAMCNESYWPGVDLSECLQYPDFSVVVLYKKVVIAFGFMVPDVKYNEAYISFLLVHPEWRRAGIATFMIYHLIQTCMGKDVTLHVSASNAAMLLYQKFGFKAEEYILDFYDKYYPVDSIECRHAFFLRLRR
ncbi:Cysteine-rich protein 2-binding protein [Dissostichus eleginoides]|nr:Cysteine-rich protein 2-binding protein [Dissostichus eleginoides]